MPLETADIAALAQHLQLHRAAAPDRTETISAVCVETPTFWPTRPETWFALKAAQYATKTVATDDTKYHHALTALDKSVVEETSAFFCTPPAQNKYEALKTLLTSIYGSNPTDKEARLLSLDALSDHKLSVLLRHMDSLTSPEDRKTTIYMALFLSHMVKVVRVALAQDPPTNIVDLAAHTDNLPAADSATELNTITAKETLHERPIQKHKSASTESMNKASRCYHHTRFGNKAHKWSRSPASPCSMVHSTQQQAESTTYTRSTSSPDGDKSNIDPFINTAVRRHLQYVTAKPDKLTWWNPAQMCLASHQTTCNRTLMTHVSSCCRNGYSIPIGGTDHPYEWTFRVADIKNCYLGADCLTTQNLAIDLRGRRLIQHIQLQRLPTKQSATSEHVGIHDVHSDDAELHSCILQLSLQISYYLTLGDTAW